MRNVQSYTNILEMHKIRVLTNFRLNLICSKQKRGSDKITGICMVKYVNNNIIHSPS
jgi:hypothetical protein